VGVRVPFSLLGVGLGVDAFFFQTIPVSSVPGFVGE